MTHSASRLGNAFQQIRRALRYAICCRTSLKIDAKSEHVSLPKLTRRYDFSTYGTSIKGSCREHVGPFWADEYFRSNPIQSGCHNNEYSVLEYFVFGNPFPHGCGFPGAHCNKDIADSLVVHIHSGDIFCEHVNFMYTQPPVAYYEKYLTVKTGKVL